MSGAESGGGVWGVSGISGGDGVDGMGCGGRTGGGVIVDGRGSLFATNNMKSIKYHVLV